MISLARSDSGWKGRPLPLVILLVLSVSGFTVPWQAHGQPIPSHPLEEYTIYNITVATQFLAWMAKFALYFVVCILLWRVATAKQQSRFVRHLAVFFGIILVAVLSNSAVLLATSQVAAVSKIFGSNPQHAIDVISTSMLWGIQSTLYSLSFQVCIWC